MTKEELAVKKKIDKINNDPFNSKGLTQREIDIAITLGVVDPDQTYFWTEEWQANYRQSCKEIKVLNYIMSHSGKDQVNIANAINLSLEEVFKICKDLKIIQNGSDKKAK